MSEHDHAHGEHDEGEHHDLPVAARVRRLEERVIAAGLASDEEIDAYLAKLYASASPVNGARMAARAWTDPGYRELLLSATEEDTVFLEELFDVGWRKAPHRVLRNKTVETWEAAGRPPSGARPGEGEVIARSSHGEIVRYQCDTPGTDFEGDIDALSLWAGQGVGLVSEIKSAGDIVREIVAQAQSTLGKLGKLAQ